MKVLESARQSWLLKARVRFPSSASCQVSQAHCVLSDSSASDNIDRISGSVMFSAAPNQIQDPALRLMPEVRMGSLVWRSVWARLEVSTAASP